jgi:two-component system CheB/CheR fusion protein
VVVDRGYDIRSINSAARHLLSINVSAIGEDLLHMVRGAHYTELRAALDTAFREGRPADIAQFAVEEVTTGEQRYLQLTCYPHRDEGMEGQVGSVIVTVSDVTDVVRARLELEERLASTTEDLERFRNEAREERERHEAQNRRLVETNRQLAETNQELTGLNEELQVTNEQYFISSEESQSAAEEVETLNEELQATNEELETLNEELQATIEELNTTNEDLNARSAELQQYARDSEEERARLSAIIESMSEAVLVVDGAGRAVLTNVAYQRLFDEEDFTPLDTLGELPLTSDGTPRGRAARGESSTTEFVVEGEDGMQRRYKAEGRPVGSDGSRGGVIVFREVADDEA